MTRACDLPQIQTDVDDFRDATEADGLTRCQHCGEWTVEAQPWPGTHWGDDTRCPACCYWCAECKDEPVLERGEMCWYCTHLAMGADEDAVFEQWKRRNP